MRCHSCNAHLSIDDEKCPYCGTPNPEAVKHRQEMHRFSGEFFRTKSSVLKTSTETAQKSIRITIICVLAVLVLAACIIMGNSWNISSAIKESQAARHEKEYSAILDRYEAEGDALSFVAFYDEKYLYGVDAYEKYQHYYRIASNYEYVYYQLLGILEEEDTENSYSNPVHYLCDYIDSYYTYLDEEHYSFYEETGMYDEVHLQAADRLTEKLEAMLKLFCSISDEDMENFRNLSNAEKQVLIERSVKGRE